MSIESISKEVLTMFQVEIALPIWLEEILDSIVLTI